MKLFREFDSVQTGLYELLASAEKIQDASLRSEIIVALARLESTINKEK